jgi:hypothetical protein
MKPMQCTMTIRANYNHILPTRLYAPLSREMNGNDVMDFNAQSSKITVNSPEIKFAYLADEATSGQRIGS